VYRYLHKNGLASCKRKDVALFKIASVKSHKIEGCGQESAEMVLLDAKIFSSGQFV